MAVKVIEIIEVPEADKINEAAKVSKARKIPFEDFRVTKVLEFNNLMTKGQKIFFLSSNSFIKRRKNFSISALASKKGLNPKNESTLLC